MIDKILLGAVDTTGDAPDSALLTAAELARAYDAEVVVVRVLPPSGAHAVSELDGAPDPERDTDDLARCFPDVRARSRAASGQPMDALVEVARQEQPDLIVVSNLVGRDGNPSREQYRIPPDADRSSGRHGQPPSVASADTGGLGQAYRRDAADLDMAHHRPRALESSRARSMAGATVRSALVGVENTLHRLMVRHSIAALRLAIGATFLGFGVLKFFPNVSPAMNLATTTTDRLTFGVVGSSVSIILIATLESVIGICLLANRWMRLALSLLAVEMVGILSPIVLLTGRLFRGPYGAPTLEGQYVLKDIVLAAAGMVVAAATFRGGHLVSDEPSPTRHVDERDTP